MSRKKRSSSPLDFFDDDLDEDTSSQSSKNGNLPVQRNAANARERARMRVLSSAFGRLKTKLPNIPPDTKLSKLDTLRLATIYIKQLKTIVEGGGVSNEENFDIASNATELGFQHGPHNMTWPFGLHHIQSSGSSRQQMNIAFNSVPTTAMDWTHTTDPYPKLQRKSGGTNSYHEEPHSLGESSHSWYMEHESPALPHYSSSGSCAYESFSQNNPNQRHSAHHSPHLHHHHQQQQQQQLHQHHHPQQQTSMHHAQQHTSIR